MSKKGRRSKAKDVGKPPVRMKSAKLEGEAKINKGREIAAAFVRTPDSRASRTSISGEVYECD